MRAGVAVAAIFEHPREQLLGRLLGLQLLLVGLLLRQQEARLQLQEGRDQDEELGGRLEVQLVALLEVLDVGDHHLAQLDLREVHALPQHHRHEQVERPREDVELEVEVGYRHGRQLRSGRGRRYDGAPTPIAARTSTSVPDAIARAFSAPCARAVSSAVRSARSSS